MIRISNLHKYFGNKHLFKGINFSVARGEVVVLIGPSGSGKSTLLRCINGLEPFQNGEVVVAGIELHSVNRTKPSRQDLNAIRSIRLKVGIVFQQFNLFPHMTVLQNIIETPITVLNVNRNEAVEHAQALLRRVNMEGKEFKYPDECSGGEQQRVAIARALAMKPEAMLFDEPTSSLDPETVGEVLSAIRDLVSEGMTSLIATHEMGFAREVADRVVIFDHGDIVETGPPEKIFSHPQVERTRVFLSRVLQKHL